MGLLDIFKPANKNGLRVAPTMTGYTPIFSDFGNNIYASDIVVESIRCKANEMKKLDPRHIRTKELRIICDKPTPINLDGEIRWAEAVEFKVAQEKIRFFYPRGLTWQAKEPANT